MITYVWGLQKYNCWAHAQLGCWDPECAWNSHFSQRKSDQSPAESFTELGTQTFFFNERPIHEEHFGVKKFLVPCLLWEQCHLISFVNKWTCTPFEGDQFSSLSYQMKGLGQGYLSIPFPDWVNSYRLSYSKKCKQKLRFSKKLTTAPPDGKSYATKLSGNWKISWIDTKNS